MRHFKLFGIYFLLGACIYALISLFAKAYIPILPNLLTWRVWVALLVVISFGFLIGTAVNKLISIPEKRNQIIHICYIGSLLIFTFLVSSKRYDEWNHEKYFSNIEANNSAIRNLVLEDQRYVKVAFDTLASCFKSPNDFRLHSFIVKKKDTILQSNVDTIFNIYFRYFLGHDQQKEYLSKISVFKSIAKASLFNADANIKYEDFDNGERGYYDKDTEENIRKSLNKLTEAEKKKISDTITKLLSE